MSSHAATALAMRTIEDSSEPKLVNRLGKSIPPSQGKSPFPLDGYLSWMSPFHSVPSPLGTPQKLYSGTNGLTVVEETAGRNAGKIITG
jgi:hypothetical protein